MKAALGFAFLFLALTALSACTTMEPRDEAPQAQAMTAEEMYMARVEQVARRRGIGVTWVNLPKFSSENAVAEE